MSILKDAPKPAQSLEELLGNLGFDAQEIMPRNRRKAIEQPNMPDVVANQLTSSRGAVLDGAELLARVDLELIRGALKEDALLLELVPTEAQLLKMHNANEAIALREKEVPGLDVDARTTISSVVLGTLQTRLAAKTDTTLPMICETHMLDAKVCEVFSWASLLVSERLDSLDWDSKLY